MALFHVALSLALGCITQSCPLLRESQLIPQLQDTEVFLLESPWTSHRISTSILSLLLQHLGYTVKIEPFTASHNALGDISKRKGPVLNVEAFVGTSVDRLAEQYNRFVIQQKEVDAFGFTGYSGRIGFYAAGNLSTWSEGLHVVVGSLLQRELVENVVSARVSKAHVEVVEESAVFARVLELMGIGKSVAAVSWPLSSFIHDARIKLQLLPMIPDFDVQLPMKLTSSDIRKTAPLAAQVLAMFTLSTEAMQELVQEAVSAAPADVACSWVLANREAWGEWLDVEQIWKINPLLLAALASVLMLVLAALWESLFVQSTIFVCTSCLGFGKKLADRAAKKADVEPVTKQQEFAYRSSNSIVHFSSNFYYTKPDGSVRIMLVRCSPCDEELRVKLHVAAKSADCSPKFCDIILQPGIWFTEVDLQFEFKGMWCPQATADLKIEETSGSVQHASVIIAQRSAFPTPEAAYQMQEACRERHTFAVVWAFIREFYKTREKKAMRTAFAMCAISIHRVAVAALIPKILVDDVISSNADLTMDQRQQIILILSAVWFLSFSCQRYADVVQLADRGRSTCRQFFRTVLRDKFLACDTSTEPADFALFINLATVHADIIAAEVWYPVFKILQSVVNLVCGFFIIVFLLARSKHASSSATAGIIVTVLSALSMLPISLIWLSSRWDHFHKLTFARSLNESCWIGGFEELPAYRAIHHSLAPGCAASIDPYHSRFKVRYAEFVTAHRAARRYQLDSSYISLWVCNVGIIAVLIAGGTDMLRSEHFGSGFISTGLFYAMLKLALRAGKDIYLINSLLLRMHRGAVSLVASCNVLNAETDTETRSQSLQLALEQCSLNGNPKVHAPDSLLALCPCMKFTDVVCKSSHLPLFQWMSGELPLGACMALTSSMGHGTSTFLKLICRILLPEAGSILIPPFAHTVFVDSEPQLINSTRDGNLLLYESFSRSRCSHDELQALRMLFGLGTQLESTTGRKKKRLIHEVFNSNKKGKSSLLDQDEGVHVKHSDADTIKLLRAILTDPDILCIDDFLFSFDICKRQHFILLISAWHHFGIEGLLDLAGMNLGDTCLESQKSRLPRTVIWPTHVLSDSYVLGWSNLHVDLSSPTAIHVKATGSEKKPLSYYKKELERLADASASAFSELHYSSI